MQTRATLFGTLPAMPLWPFRKKQKAAGLAINRNFYLSILSSESLPPLLQVINPDGSNGAVKGFGAPLQEGASKDALNRPLSPGAYALTTTDKLTLVQMDVFEKGQVGFKLPADANALQSANLTGEKLRRAQNAIFITNLVFRGFDPAFYTSVRFFLDAAARLGELSAGAVADPMAETYRMPEDLKLHPKMDPRIDFRELGALKFVGLPDGIWASTRGLAKFDLPELEMYGLPQDLLETAGKMLISAAQQMLIGIPLKPGETAFSISKPLQVSEGTKQQREWGQRRALELHDADGSAAVEGVRAWAEQDI